MILIAAMISFSFNFVRMRQQADRWGAELFQEDVEFVDVKNRPFTVRSTDREVKTENSSSHIPCFWCKI